MAWIIFGLNYLKATTMDNLIFNSDFNKLYPNRITKNTSNSDTVRQMEISNERMKKEGGISFYCKKRNEYIYISNNKLR